MELGGGDVQLLAPVSFKQMEENYSNINVVESLNSQSNIPPTHKRKSYSDNAHAPDTTDSKKLHIEFSTDVTASLGDRIESVETDNMNINSTDVSLSIGEVFADNSMCKCNYVASRRVCFRASNDKRILI